jgi:2-hydroxychromene-2-carboxylate isomerase
MSSPIRFYMDFASPYAYFASRAIEAVGAEFGRPVEWRPILMWAVLKAHGIAAPMDVPVKRSYLLADMERSAAFHGLDYRHPVKLPMSAHLAARLHHAVAAEDPATAGLLAHALFEAFFRDHRDVADMETLVAIGASVGLSRETVVEGATGTAGRALLEAAVAEAIGAGVVGSPYFIVDGEGLFGADRLPQVRLLLSGGRA